MRSRIKITNALHDMIINGRYEERDVDTLYDAIETLNKRVEKVNTGEICVKLEDIQNFPIRKDHCDQKNGNVHFINGIETVMEYIDYLPRYTTDNENVISEIYKEIKEKWRELRNAGADPDILVFLMHLQEEIEEKIFYPNHCGDTEE